MTQLEQVKLHLEEHNTITSWDAIQKYHITRLSALIWILRHEHKMDINSDWKSNTNASWVEYRLANV
mgnify:CR=1 FL=1|tara:strand:- start:1129 stop:1329 length:201 start_codon:yes stop_codon:yes gene_type:complete